MVICVVRDKHVIEALGKTRVTIENGKVSNVEKPLIEYCPIFAKYRNIEEITPELVRENIQFRIDDFGMCTKNRQIKMSDMLSVGISEILRSNLEIGNIDCVVGACEGVGTLLMTDADIVQGVGGRVSGLVSTTPIPEVMEKIGIENVLDPQTAQLNPIKGLEKAINEGYKNIAITILPSPLIKKIREYDLPSDVNVYLFVAHTTGISMDETKDVFKYADIVTSCASKNIRDYASKIKPYYYGSSVPIYAVSDMGRKFLDTRLEKIGKSLSTNKYPQENNNIPNPLV